MIQRGLIFGAKRIVFVDNQDIRLIPTIGIFITMNPGYAGRSELPDNLKALFRPVTMCVPDLGMICENMLMSEGFTEAKVLAKKMTVLYKLSKEQLSKQYHYDFGLRALKSVLVMAGQLKRQYSTMNEAIVLMRALRDMNMPKFVFEDVPLFKGLIQDLFPGLKADRVGYEELNGHISDYMEANNMRHSERDIFDKQIDKVVQLYETMLTRHTTMVVGPTGAGKSVIIDALAKSLKPFTGATTYKFVINPKMITLNELYGVLDPDSRDWTDGLLSKVFKEINVDLLPDKPEFRWIIYDGDVDAIWVENMNSVMDDNRILTLANNDRIRLLNHCKMLFEVYDLQYASPATISRCGMVYVDPKDLGYAPYYERWLLGKKEAYNESMQEAFSELYSRYVPYCIDRIFEGNAGAAEEPQAPLTFITPRTNLNCIVQLCDLVDSMLPPADATQPPPEDADALDMFFVFCITWSLGACLVESERETFSDFVWGLSQNMRAAGTLYDNFFDFDKNQFSKWDVHVQDYVHPIDRNFASILVPTVDTVRYSWLQMQFMSVKTAMNSKRPVLFCGESGTAKTVTV
jgi:dynein heavy chain